MAAKILDDILSNYLTVDSVLDWLLNKITANEENIFLNQYECTQRDFVSYFLVFLREQTSRDFEIYDAETPRKNSQSRIIKNFSPAVEKSSLLSKNHQSAFQNLDLESLQSFPNLSSSFSNIDSDKKHYESTPNNSAEVTNRSTSEKKFRRVKLFSETLEGSAKNHNSFKKEVDFLEDDEQKSVSENKFAVSTPKPFKNSSLPVVNCFKSPDFQSEISPKFGKPRWKNHSVDNSTEFNSVTPKSRSFSGDSSHKSKDKVNCRMSLGDFLSFDSCGSDMKREKKNKTRKRINPTKINNLSQNSINSSCSDKTESSFENKVSVSDKRECLKLECEKIEDALQKVKIDDFKTPVKNPPTISETVAELELVSYSTELKILSRIYSCLISENYCQNIMIELCFLISLLVLQDYNKKTSDFESAVSLLKEKKSLFGTVHNCVYFAVETLWLQRHLLLYFNLPALKLLSENSRIEKFHVRLKDFLVNAYQNKQSSDEIRRNSGFLKTSTQGFVSFQYETDNRENFTSDVSFHSFRKQRDLFYNILAIWEANHLVSGWIFSIGLGSKIRSLLSMSSDPINLLHLSRLFRSQLVMSCCGENQAEESINEEILQLLPSADPNKILRLRARLTSSPKRQGPCPVPDFTGYQEFYKDFILCTSHSGFHEHLKNSLCDEILRLNDTEFTGDIEDDDLCLDEQTQERYFQCVNILRLLAKFLGFVEFLPYRGEKPFSDKVLNIHCSVRNSTLPLFDALSCLNTAIKKQKLTLTVPWMVSYLSMIDPYSAHLKVYQSLWRLLIFIYKHLNTFRNSRNAFYLKLVLGWIFQLPNFPSEQFYGFMEEYQKSSEDLLGISFGEEAKVGLDFYEFIEETILYGVCPFLNEINTILSENLACSVRHIRPVTTQENSFSKLQASKQLELRLESSFLHNQSSSTRKTVEFVTERVASVTIKHLVHNVIKNIKENSWAELDKVSPSDLKEAETESETLAEKCYHSIITACEKENWEISSKRSETAVKALLSSDLQGSVADTCAKIAARQATEKVQRWMQSHVTLAMVKNEFVSLTKKKFMKKSSENVVPESSDALLNKSQRESHLLPPSGRGVVHDPNAWPPSHTLKSIRELIWKIYEDSCSVKEVIQVMMETIRTVESRDDIIPAAEKTLVTLNIDLIVAFCIRSDVDVPTDIFKQFSKLLKSFAYQNYSNYLERLVCPRNVALVRNDAKSKEKAWRNIGNLLLFMLEEDFLTKEQLETQLLSLLRLHWEKDEGIQFANFISVILDRYLKCNSCDKFSLLLEYMIETFRDEEPKSETLD